MVKLNNGISDTAAAYMVDEKLLKSDQACLGENPDIDGYKQTEIGMIPNEWNLFTIDDVADFSGGSQPPRSTFSFVPKPGYIRLIQIRDYKTSDYETYIPLSFANKRCSNEDIMIGRYGPPIFQILRGIEGAYNVALIKVLPKQCIQREYLYYFLKSDNLYKLMDMLSQRSSGQTGVELPSLKAYPIPIPPKVEQTAIANALSDVDRLLENLEALIAKKRAIKIATMQQLLTGRTRLPQFALRPDGSHKGTKHSEVGDIPEDWNCVLLGDVTQIVMGQSPSSANYNRNGYGLPLIQGNADIENRKTVIRNYTTQLTKKGFKSDVIMSVRAPVGEIAVAQFDCCLGRGVCAIRYPNRYLYHWLVMYESEWEKFSKGSTFDSINGDELKKVAISLPEVTEQTALAGIFDDMDDEIRTSELRLSKTRQIKLGMMQELLSGRTRLI